MHMQIQHHKYTRFITQKQLTTNTELNNALSYNYAQVTQQQEARSWQEIRYVLSFPDRTLAENNFPSYLYSSECTTYIHMWYFK